MNLVKTETEIRMLIEALMNVALADEETKAHKYAQMLEWVLDEADDHTNKTFERMIQRQNALKRKAINEHSR